MLEILLTPKIGGPRRLLF